MKGIIFTEFLDMVESTFGYDMVDQLIVENESKLASGGSYTAIGTYSHKEIVQLVTTLSQKSGMEVSKLLYTFALHLFDVLSGAYPHFLESASNAFDFLESIENYIHVEVRKLYPDAELPTFETQRLNDDTLQMVYLSSRKMGPLAKGLIEKALQHYQEKATIKEELLQEDGSKVKFIITKYKEA